MACVEPTSNVRFWKASTSRSNTTFKNSCILGAKLVRRAAQPRPLDDAFREMAEWSKRMFLSADGQEGMASFREKRKPSWVKK